MNFFSNLMRQGLLTVLSIAYLILWTGGVVSHVLRGGPPTDMSWTVSLFLLLAGAIVLSTSGLSEIQFLLLAGIMGFIAEVAGVHSGVIFSGYWYADLLQPQLMNVPLVMICAWLVLIGYVRQMLIGCSCSRWLIVVIAGAWMMAIDLVIDPLAGGVLGYWRWLEKGIYYGIPAHNFLGWFAVTLVIFASLRGQVIKNAWAQHTGLSIILFFTVLAWIYGLVLAGVVGVGLCILHFMVVGSKRLKKIFPGVFPFSAS
jgi:putative membrane protein